MFQTEGMGCEKILQTDEGSLPATVTPRGYLVLLWIFPVSCDLRGRKN